MWDYGLFGGGLLAIKDMSMQQNVFVAPHWV